MIEVEALTKLYDKFTAVDGLSLTVRPGEVLGLVGCNGAGKTTTLRCLAGIIPPTRGTVRLCGHDIGRDPIAAKRTLAFFPDEPRLFEYLTVEQHLAFVARIYQVADYRERARPLLEELEIDNKAGVLPAELSRGMKQKLAIACGLLHGPQVILFDEPLTGLDPIGIRRMKATILRRASEGGRDHHFLAPPAAAGGGVLARPAPAQWPPAGGRHAGGDRPAVPRSPGRRRATRSGGNFLPGHEPVAGRGSGTVSLRRRDGNAVVGGTSLRDEQNAGVRIGVERQQQAAVRT